MLKGWKTIALAAHLFFTCATAFAPPVLLRRQTSSSSVVRGRTSFPQSLRQSLSDDDGSSSSEEMDMDVLRQRIEQQQSQYYDLIMADEQDGGATRPVNVFIIVFNPESDEQGVHAIEFPQGSGNNIILAFESEKDCTEFSDMLKQDSMQFHDPIPSETELEGLESFCSAMGVPVKVVPEGKDLRPPSVDSNFDRREVKSLESTDDDSALGMWE